MFSKTPNLADGPQAAGTAEVGGLIAGTGTNTGASTNDIRNVLLGAAAFKLNRSIARREGKGEWAESPEKSDNENDSNHGNTKRKEQQAAFSFDDENSRNQRLVSNSNQFSTEPPDQGLCVGNGCVLESVNTVMKIYDRSGKSLSGGIALNAFCG